MVVEKLRDFDIKLEYYRFKKLNFRPVLGKINDL
jgi:hypothetical protein